MKTRFHIVSMQRTASKYFQEVLTRLTTVSNNPPILIQGHPLGEVLHAWNEVGFNYHKSTASFLGNNDIPDSVRFHTHPEFDSGDSDYGVHRLKRTVTETGLVKVFSNWTHSLSSEYTNDVFTDTLAFVSSLVKDNSQSFVMKTQLSSFFCDPLYSKYTRSLDDTLRRLVTWHEKNEVTPIVLIRRDFTRWAVSMFLSEQSGVFVPGTAQDQVIQGLDTVIIPDDYLSKLLNYVTVHAHITRFFKKIGACVLDVGRESKAQLALKLCRAAQVSVQDRTKVRNIIASVPTQTEFLRVAPVQILNTEALAKFEMLALLLSKRIE